MTESNIRKKLKRRGFILSKSRGAENADNMGEYQILSGFNGMIIDGYRHEMTLEAVANWLTDYDREGGESV